MGVVDGGKELEDALDFEDPFIDNVASKGNIADWSAKEIESARSCARNASVERILVVIVGEVGSTPHERFGGIHVESRSWAVRLDDVDDALEVFPSTDEGSVVQVEDVE